MGRLAGRSRQIGWDRVLVGGWFGRFEGSRSNAILASSCQPETRPARRPMCGDGLGDVGCDPRCRVLPWCAVLGRLILFQPAGGRSGATGGQKVVRTQ